MLVIGLTGGIASGKSTVASMFADKGIPIIDADNIAHDLTKAGQESYLSIKQRFKNILLKNGELNRKKLRQIIFNQPAERLWMENLLHPLILQRIKWCISELDCPYCIVIIPLLIEKGPFSFIDRILLVEALPEKQIQRAVLRDQATEAEIRTILKTQTSAEQYLLKADDVIKNNGNIKNLTLQVDKLHIFYLKLSQNK